MEVVRGWDASNITPTSPQRLQSRCLRDRVAAPRPSRPAPNRASVAGSGTSVGRTPAVTCSSAVPDSGRDQPVGDGWKLLLSVAMLSMPK